MEDKNISSKFTLQTQTKYKNTKIKTYLQGLLTMRYVFSVNNQKTYSAKVSYCQNSEIREVSIAWVWQNNWQSCQMITDVKGGPGTLATSDNGDIHYDS